MMMQYNPLKTTTLTVAIALGLFCLPSKIAESAEFRSIDGTGNNLSNPTWGSPETQLLHLSTVGYDDGIFTPRNDGLPSARAISNSVFAQSDSIFNSVGASDFLWQWGQFLDHDIDLTENAAPAEPFNIAVPTGDPFFDPFNTGTQEIGLNRSIYDPTTGTDISNPRQQINEITAFIDGSNVYGSDTERADALRTFSGGKLKTSDGNLLPFNLDGLENAGGTGENLFLAGDIRANEQIGLSAMHTLFVREHNRLADEIAAADPSLSDEEIYEEARTIVGAQMQIITYNEFLPMLLGEESLDPYSGYDQTIDPSISNEFSTAAYRVGHTMLSPTLQLLDENGDEIPTGNVALREAFFDPTLILDHGIDPILRGLGSQFAQEVDTQVVDDVRNFLFGPPGSGGFDLVSLNIQRGRDHGLASYNQARIDFGLDAVTSFADITSDISLQNALASIYTSVDDIDLWVGGLAEKHVNGGMVGELFSTIIADQFGRLRDGDRFWYENVFYGEELVGLQETTLADIIRRNTDIENIQDNVFLVSKPESVPEPTITIALLGLGTVCLLRRRRV